MEIRVERASGFCDGCRKDFADGEIKTAALLAAGEEDSFRRQDFCTACWQSQDPEAYRCYWLTSHSLRRRPALLDADVLWQVLLGAAPTEKTPGEPEFAYVAALGLMRMRQLSLDETIRDGKKLIHVFNTKGSASRSSFRLVDPGLDEKAMESVQERLAEYADTRGVTAPVPDTDGSLTPTQQYQADLENDPESTRKVRPRPRNT